MQSATGPGSVTAGDRLAGVAIHVLAALLGVGVGLVGSFMQAATWRLVGVRFPVGLVAALVVSTVVIVGSGVAARSRVGAVLAFVGWLLATSVMTLKRPEGDLVVPATPYGVVWLLGGTVLGGIALVWPYGARARRR